MFRRTPGAAMKKWLKKKKEDWFAYTDRLASQHRTGRLRLTEDGVAWLPSIPEALFHLASAAKQKGFTSQLRLSIHFAGLESGKTALLLSKHFSGRWHLRPMGFDGRRQPYEHVVLGFDELPELDAGDLEMPGYCCEGADVWQAVYTSDYRTLLDLMLEPVEWTWPNEHGFSLLHCAERPRVAGFLLDQGVDPNARDRKGRTPLFFAMSRALVHRLIAGGADIHAVSHEGVTAIEAMRRNSIHIEDIERHLRRRKGAKQNAVSAACQHTRCS